MAPAHLALDLLFLEFVKGDRMFPYRRKETVSFEEILPHYCMPSCRARCRFFNSFWTVTTDLNNDYRLPHVRYDCTCLNPFSLMCQSASKVICTYWLDQVQEYFHREQAKNPSPYIGITNFNFVTIGPPGQDGHLRYEINPLSHLYNLLSHRAVRRNYALRRIPGGFEVLIEPAYGNEKLLDACKMLRESLQALPFRLIITCYPFCKVSA